MNPKRLYSFVDKLLDYLTDSVILLTHISRENSNKALVQFIILFMLIAVISIIVFNTCDVIFDEGFEEKSRLEEDGGPKAYFYNQRKLLFKIMKIPFCREKQEGPKAYMYIIHKFVITFIVLAVL